MLLMMLGSKKSKNKETRRRGRERERENRKKKPAGLNSAGGNWALWSRGSKVLSEAVGRPAVGIHHAQ